MQASTILVNNRAFSQKAEVSRCFAIQFSLFYSNHTIYLNLIFNAIRNGMNFAY